MWLFSKAQKRKQWAEGFCNFLESGPYLLTYKVVIQYGDAVIHALQW